MKKYFRTKSTLEIIALISTLLGITIVGLFLARAWYDGYIILNNPISLDRASKIGDFIGGLVGVIFTLVGVFLLIETLSLQRNEFISNRKAFNHQLFENGLFNLMASQREILSDTKYNGKNGREFFSFLKTEIIKTYKLIKTARLPDLYPMEETIINQLLTVDYITKRHNCNEGFVGREANLVTAFKEIFQNIDRDNEEKVVTEAYWIIFYKYHNYYGHYFRHLYHILKYIYESEIYSQENTEHEKDEKHEERYRNYADLIQSTLSTDELLIMFFNGICFKNMGKLLHKYNFLENLPIEDLLDKTHVTMYNGKEIDGVQYKAIKFKSMNNEVS